MGVFNIIAKAPFELRDQIEEGLLIDQDEVRLIIVCHGLRPGIARTTRELQSSMNAHQIITT